MTLSKRMSNAYDIVFEGIPKREFGKKSKVKQHFWLISFKVALALLSRRR